MNTVAQLRTCLEKFTARQTNALPEVSPLLLKFFALYARRYLAKHFHAVRISCGQTEEENPSPEHAPRTTAPRAQIAALAGLVANDWPLVLYGNHSSWWDPMVGIFLTSTFFPKYELYAPIDAAALQRYGIFRKLGFFGVEQGTTRGATQFLRISCALLSRPRALLCLTPQGRFVDPRERPVRFKPGLGHLATHLPRACFLAVAVEYPFWEERTAEVLIRFAEPIMVEKGRTLWNADEWNTQFEASLTAAQDALAQDSQQRNTGRFQTILRGGTGVGGIYDRWRAWRQRLRGESFQKEHSDL